MFYTTSMTQPVILMLSKVSILLLLRRIFTTPAFRHTTTVLLVIVCAWFVAVETADGTICLPLNSRWNPMIAGHCGDQVALDQGSPIPWIVTDFAILLCPLPMVRKLHMPTRQRVALACLFLIGSA